MNIKENYISAMYVLHMINGGLISQYNLRINSHGQQSCMRNLCLYNRIECKKLLLLFLYFDNGINLVANGTFLN